MPDPGTSTSISTSAGSSAAVDVGIGVGDVALLRDALAMLVEIALHGSLPGGDSGDHALIGDADGDGWNEPYSATYACTCEDWEGIHWSQTDPDCTGQPDPVTVALAWRAHYLTVTGQHDPLADDVSADVINGFDRNET